MLERADFNNDAVDAGDIGSGHTVTALYEITPVGGRTQSVDPLRYGDNGATQRAPTPAGEYAYVKIRYKLPTEDQSRLIERAVTTSDVENNFNRLPEDIRFAASVAGAGQLIRNDPYIRNFDYERAIAIAEAARSDDEYGYRGEFISLLRQAQNLTGRRPLQ
jgi:Ca-activated chloride channel family protein